MSTAAASSGLHRRPFPLTTPLRYVPFSTDLWCPVMPSRDLRSQDLKVVPLLGQPVVFFRGRDGRVGAIDDRCPHRGIALSMGRVIGNHLQCAYHGWLVGREGLACGAPNIGRLDTAPCTRAYAVQEHVGMIWAFLGDLHRAEQVPLPRVTPYGDSGSVGLVVATKVEAHWSFLLDNGIDLFHGHLHRDVPYFFSIQAIEDFGSDGDEFVVRYRATIGGPFRTRRRGIITIRTEGTGMMLDLDGYPIVHGLVTPHTADGRRFTTWYMVAFALPPVHRLVVRILMPALRRCLRRGFCEDSAVLASEQAAFDTGCRTQWEVNPVVPAVHRHVEDLIVRRAWRLRSEGAQPVRIARATLLQCAGRGEIAVFGRRAGQPSLIPPSELDGCLPDRPLVEVMQYRNCYFLNAS